MLKSPMKILTIILTLFTLMRCSERTSEQENKTKVTDNSIDKKSNSQKSTFDQDSIDFLKAIKSLENINFFINGQDSIVVTEDPNDLIELNTTKSAFLNSFAKANTGLTKYKTVDLVRKYHVKLKDGKSGERPSSNIIQLTFKDNQVLEDCFSIYDKNPNKSFVDRRQPRRCAASERIPQQ